MYISIRFKKNKTKAVVQPVKWIKQLAFIHIIIIRIIITYYLVLHIIIRIIFITDYLVLLIIIILLRYYPTLHYKMSSTCVVLCIVTRIWVHNHV